MKMNVQRPAFEQIQDALSKGYELCLDARTEAMGDKIALTAVAKWLVDKTGADICIVESKESARTPLLLSDYDLPARVRSEALEVDEQLPYFNCHTAGTGADSLWVLNPYLSMIGYHTELRLKTQPKQLADIVFAGLTHTPYNQRRDMDPKQIRATVNQLRSQYSTALLYDKPSAILDDALNLPLAEAIEIIAGAKIFVGGDTGLSHVAAALGIPVVALYPDWIAPDPNRPTVSKVRSIDSIVISEWWQINAYYTPTSFLPNATQGKLAPVMIDTQHIWSIDHVLQCVKRLMP